MFSIFGKKTEEERMCDKYTQLMHRAYELALTDKKKSDRINYKARKILRKLRGMNYQELDKVS